MTVPDLLPHDADSERFVIGAVLARPQLRDQLDLAADDFHTWRHALIWSAMRSAPVAEPQAVLEQLAVSGDLARTGGGPYLHTCMADAPASVTASYYAERLRGFTARRRIIEALETALEDAKTETDPDQLLERTERLIAAVPTRTAPDVDSLMSVDDFIDRDLGPAEWVVPGLLQRRERLIVTAGEGVGKSTLIRQLGMCAAAGMHPFTGRTVAPCKVLVIDCENPERIMQERLRELRRAIRAHGNQLGDRMWIDRREEGMNLADPADRRWLMHRAEAIQPDMLVIGPAYKLYIGGSKDRDEDIARGVAGFLDELRTRVGCAVLLEHHSAKATDGRTRTVQPFGSSLWMRWPEFGIGLQAAERPLAAELRLVDVKHWRGPRDSRGWPHRLQSGGDAMPWVEASPNL